MVKQFAGKRGQQAVPPFYPDKNGRGYDPRPSKGTIL